ncbi:MAG: hypothetical protein WDM78_04625 [Puia sp.]
MITRLSYGKNRLEWLKDHHEQLVEKERRVEEQDIDPALEYDIQKSRESNKPAQA